MGLRHKVQVIGWSSPLPAWAEPAKPPFLLLHFAPAITRNMAEMTGNQNPLFGGYARPGQQSKFDKPVSSIRPSVQLMQSFFRICLWCCCLMAACPLAAQKNLLPASQSKLTGIALPASTKEDKRMLMRAAAKTTLDMEASDSGLLLGDAYEVYLLPAMDRSALSDSVSGALTMRGWNLPSNQKNAKWWLVRKDKQEVMVYMEVGKKESSLYLAEVKGKAPANITATPAANAGLPAASTPSAANGTNRNTNTSGVPSAVRTGAGSYAFTTTNFDDGWTSTVHDDYVLVEKGNHAVYLLYHVPYNASQFSGTGLRDAEYYWDNYGTKYFNTKLKQFNDGGSIALKPPYMEGYGVDRRTGKSCFLGMYLLIVPNATSVVIGTAPDEASFRKLFPKANEFAGSDLAEMDRYNKFAIGPADLVGKWQNGNTETAQWYYTSPAGYEGYAGMTLAATSATFLFNSNGTYTSIHNGATGAVGSMNTFQQEYKGAYKVTNWVITATNRWQGQTGRFDAYFKAVRGGRILLINDSGTKYTLVRTQ
jgi:hypothetical protein